MGCGLEGYLPFVYGLMGAAIFSLGGSLFFEGKSYYQKLTKQKQTKVVKTIDVNS